MLENPPRRHRRTSPRAAAGQRAGSGTVAQLRTAIESAPASGARGIVLSVGGMFRADSMPVLLQLDRDMLTAFLRDFFGLCGRPPGASDRRRNHRT
jgi:hypothetical protein